MLRSVKGACESICRDVEIPFLVIIEVEHVHGVDVVCVHQFLVLVVLLLSILCRLVVVECLWNKWFYSQRLLRRWRRCRWLPWLLLRQAGPLGLTHRLRRHLLLRCWHRCRGLPWLLLRHAGPPGQAHRLRRHLLLCICGFHTVNELLMAFGALLKPNAFAQ